MLRKLLPCCGLVLLFCFGSLGYTSEAHFRVGEVLQYKLFAKTAIYGANEDIKIVSRGTFNGQDVYRVHSEMATVGVVKGIYSYSQTEDLIMDAQEFYPYWIRLTTQERSKNQVDEIRFNYTAGKATRIVTENGKTETSEIELPGYIQDQLSLIFFLRQNQIGEKSHKIYFYGSNGRIKPSNFTIRQISKPIRLESGTYPKYLQIDDYNNKITVMIAENRERLPILVKKIAKFGSVEMKLSKTN